jgi:phage terminase small subunit
MSGTSKREWGRACGITEMQRKFCDEMLSQPMEAKNQTLAAINAGAKPKNAAITASKWLRISKVQEYLRERLDESRALVETRTGRTVADLAECLEYLTTVKRARIGDYLTDSGEVDIQAIKNAPAGLIRKIKVRSTTDAEGQVYAQHEIELESGIVATQTLVRHYDALDAPPPAAAVIEKQVNILLNMSTQGLLELKALYSRAKAIDAETAT